MNPIRKQRIYALIAILIGSILAVGLVEPIIVKATPAPAGRAGIADLKIRLGVQDATQAGESDVLFWCLPEQFGQKPWTFKPPVAEKLGIKGSNEQRLDGHPVVELVELPPTAL